MKTKFTLLILLLIGISWSMKSQSSKKGLDIAAIKSMAGCYNVEFKYTETFAPEVDYEFAYDYTSAAFEWAEIIEESEDKIVLQHLLIINDSMIIKHWRQDWEYESNHRYVYDKDQTWKHHSISDDLAIGTWTQKVFQVDDSPRYSGTATWTHVDGKSKWEHKADSPLPRREYSKRSDYNVMKRGNRVQITNYGWLHEQDNDKIIRKDESEDVLLAQEKGYNVYTKRPDSDCKPAQNWWNENESMWSDVRDLWDEVFDRKEELNINNKIEGKRLYEHLFYAQEQLEKPEIKTLIDSYLSSN